MVAPVRVTGSSIISATPSRRVMRNVRPLLSPSPFFLLASLIARRVHSLLCARIAAYISLFRSLEFLRKYIPPSTASIDPLVSLRTASAEKKNRVLRKSSENPTNDEFEARRKLPIIGRVKVPWLMEIRSADSLISERNAQLDVRREGSVVRRKEGGTLGPWDDS